MSIIEKLGITPGPWHYGEHGHIVTEFGKTVCQTHEDKGFIFKNEKNNGPIIAAAPEMLEALIFHIENGSCREAHEKMIDAVQKATGKTWEEIKELL